MKRNCPICNGENKSVLYKQRFERIKGVTFLSEYDVVTCDNCGAGFADNIPEQKVFSKYYKNFSKYEKKYIEPIQNFIPSKTYVKFFDFVRQYINKSAYVVDIGCGSGDLLRVFKDNGFSNIKGIDPSQECVDYIQFAHGISGEKSDIENLSAEYKYDCIILSTVLEHIANLHSTINKIWKLLNDNGIVCIVVPDGSKFSNDDDAPFQQFSTEHINYFSNISLKNLMNKYGFSEVISKGNKVVEKNIKWIGLNAIYRKVNNVECKIENDYKTKIDLIKYINKSEKNDKKINKIFLSLAKTKEPIIIWGIGTFTLHSLASSQLKNCNIVALVDSSTKFKNIDSSYKILSLDELKKYDCKILIGSLQYQEEIKRQIKEELGLKNELICLW